MHIILNIVSCTASLISSAVWGLRPLLTSLLMTAVTGMNPLQNRDYLG